MTTASEKMAARVILVERLTLLDSELEQGLRQGFGDPSLRAVADARRMLDERRSICAEMLTVGFRPWAIPTTSEEEEAI